MLAFDLTAAELMLAAAIMTLAGFVRGFSGFGFSMVAVTGLSMLRPPAEIIPMVLILEILASAHLMVSSWRHVDWASLRWLAAGMLLATPIGVWCLAAAPPNVMRMVISLLVLIAALALMSGWRLQARPGVSLTLATGAVSGFLNGVASLAGPPVIVFYFSSPAAVEVSRASLIAFFLLCDLVALAAGGGLGLVGLQTWQRALCFVLPVAAGVLLGQRAFRRSNPTAFRRHVLVLLVVLSALGMLRALLAG